MYNSTILQKVSNTFARHGLHQTARFSISKMFTEIRLRYSQTGLPLLFSGLKFFLSPIMPRKILRRRRDYYRVSIARTSKQWKLAVSEFFKMVTPTTDKTQQSTSILGRLLNATLNSSVINPSAVFRHHENIWDITRLHPGLRRRQRFTH